MLPTRYRIRPIVLVLTGLALVIVSARGIAATAPTPPVDTAQENKLVRAIGKKAKAYRTGHFVIASDADPALVKNLSSRLERTFESVDRFSTYSGFIVKPLTRRLEVLFFDTWAEYRRYGKTVGFQCDGTNGFYYETTNISAFFNVENDPQLIQLEKQIETARASILRMDKRLKSMRGGQAVEMKYPDGKHARMTPAQARVELESAQHDLDKLDRRRQDYCDRTNRTVVQHEVAHQVFYNTGVHVRGGWNPKWLVEGLACIFETPPSSEGSGLGAINQARLENFRTAVAGSSDGRKLTSGSYAAAVAARRVVSLEDLICRPELFDQRGERGAAAYAVAWGLTYFLQRVHTKLLPGYLQDVAMRQPGEKLSPAQELDLFEKHFGPVDATFVRQFTNFILGLPYRPDAGL